MNICLIANEYPLDQQSHGAGFFTYYLAHQLTESGHQVHIITPGLKNTTLQDQKVTIHKVRKSWPKLFNFLEKKLHLHYHGALHFLALSKSIAKKIEQIHKSTPLDIIEIPEGGGIGYHFLKKNNQLKIPTITRIHSPLFYQFQFNDHKLPLHLELLKKINRLVITHLEKYSIKKSNEVIAPSQAFANIIQKALPQVTPKIIPNPINLKAFPPHPHPKYPKNLNNPKSPHLPPPLHILTVTTISKGKGTDLFIETALKTLKKHPNTIFHIVGPDTKIATTNKSYKEYLIKKYKLTEHEDKIIFEGYKNHQEIQKFYQQADIFAFTSRMESFGLAILEALATSLPTIAFAVGGIPEIITTEQNGILIPPYKVTEFANRLSELITSPEKRQALSQQAQLSTQNYDIQKITEQNIAEYKLLQTPKALFLTYFFPPKSSSATQRISKFAKYLPNFNWQAIVIKPARTTEENSDYSLWNEVKNKIKLYPTWSPASLSKKTTTSPNPSNLTSSSHLPPSLSSHSLSSSSSSSTSHIPSHFTPSSLLPIDPQILWLPFLIPKALHIIKKDSPKLIFVSGYPFSLFIAGAILKKLTNTPLVLSFHDPWTLNPYLTERKNWLNKKLESWCIKTANSCIFTTQKTTELYTQTYPKESQKFQTIHNGYDSPSLATPISTSTSAQNSNSTPNSTTTSTPIPPHFTLLHTGTLNNSRSPQPAIEILNRLFQTNPELKSQITLKFTGPCPPAIKTHYQSPNIIFQDFIPHQELIKEIEKASALLLITGNQPNGKNIIPGKLFEYIASQKPIFAITYEDSETAEIIQKASPENKVISHNQTESGANTLLDLYKSQQTPKIKPQNQSFISQFHREKLTEKLVHIFNTISS